RAGRPRAAALLGACRILRSGAGRPGLQEGLHRPHRRRERRQWKAGGRALVAEAEERRAGAGPASAERGGEEGASGREGAGPEEEEEEARREEGPQQQACCASAGGAGGRSSQRYRLTALREQEKTMVRLGLFVRLKAKSGKEAEVAKFLEGALPAAQ